MMMPRSSKMAVAVAAMTQLAVVRGQCTYEHEGFSLDLGGLTKTGSNSDGYYQVNSTQYTSYKFLFNICGPINWQDFASPNVCPSGSTGSCEVQLVGDTELVSENYGAATGYTITHQNGENGQPAGPVVTMNSTECTRLQDGSNVQTKIYLVCDDSATTPIAEIIKDSYWECYMHATLRTNLVCGGAGPAYPDANYSAEEEAGDDVGMLLCVFFFVGFGLYFGIGATMLHRKGERGFDRVPQKEFWSSLPGLVTDGFSFSKNMVQSKIQGGGSGGGYDSM